MEMCPDHYCAVHTTLLLQSAIIIRRNVKKSKTQGKIKCRLDTVPKHDAMVANGESGSKASWILNFGKRDVNNQLHAPVALPSTKGPWYALDNRLDEPNSQSVRGGEDKSL
jgi:hypothetical protein